MTTSGLDQLLANVPSSQPLTVADLGCGGGDMLKLMAHWARKRGRPVQFTGIDANGWIVDYARQNTADYPEITYRQLDIFSPEFRELRFDVVTGTLFCHHFTDEQLLETFSGLRQQTRLGVVINDLHRHPLAYHSISLLTRWFSKSYLVRNDARLSVLRSFRRNELLDLFRRAGWENSRLTWNWAFRWQAVLRTEPANH